MQIYPEKEQTYSKVSYNLLLLPLMSPNHEDEHEFLQQSMNLIKDKRSYNPASLCPVPFSGTFFSSLSGRVT